MTKKDFEIPYYHDYISPSLAHHLIDESCTVEGVPGLRECGRGGGLETTAALKFLVELYEQTKTQLAQVLQQRTVDRKFIDDRVRAYFEFNQSLGRDISDRDYKTILGLQDGTGRTVIGPLSSDYSRASSNNRKPIAPLPDFLTGPHVTLFGPPDSAKLAINAMNAFHRKPKNEPPIVDELLGQISPMWGADDEDSKTPLRADLVNAAVNLTACFDETISLQEGDRRYSLASDHLSLPIKRFPGLALPATFLFYNENPIPLHLYDFALHLFTNWQNPRALVFYVPKIENEEEAAYVHKMVEHAERLVKKANPSYQEGSVRLMIVLENPRAILRAHEIMDALYPYFAGASLGWHDYLASTARIFKEDRNYRIPVKADPGIVIKYIKASHHLLAETVGSRGGIRVGGMYGILPLAGDESSLQVTLKGFIKDVVTQLKRGLNGFWVAHPDFVRLGLALVEAWRRSENGDRQSLQSLVKSLLAEKYHDEILGFIAGPDIEALDQDDAGYTRALLVADIKESDFIANNHPDEIRYNVFQSLQYLADWLSGNGCVALPTHLEGVNVRVMDDLATAERSRWEVWHEVYHGRFSTAELLKIAHEELNFIRRDLQTTDKITQVKWDSRTEKWYPVAFKIMLKLMTDSKPVEFATELLMPFTVESIRAQADPWRTVDTIEAKKYELNHYVSAFSHYFEACGAARFAGTMVLNPIEDLGLAKQIVLGFLKEEVIEAAAFHGEIGDPKKVLDAQAAKEQALVLKEDGAVRGELSKLGRDYLEKFGFKFLISAQGKTAGEIREALLSRTSNDSETELENAREALWEICWKRLQGEKSTSTGIIDKIEALRLKHKVKCAAVSIAHHLHSQHIAFGSCSVESEFEIASLSKTLASALALEYFRFHKILLSTSVNDLFKKTKSTFRLRGAWADDVQIAHLMNHTALNMHYVNGFPIESTVPPVRQLLDGRHGYEEIKIIAKPGTKFHYSGGGFLVLEHLLEAVSGEPVTALASAFFDSLGIENLTFDSERTKCVRKLDFPAFAAGAFGTSASVLAFLKHLTDAYHSVGGSKIISHDTAIEMLYGVDKGARLFMGCETGRGVFIAEAGENRVMVHQGANEGFRSLFVHCFKGPDCGKGVVIFAKSDNNGVGFIAETAREILRSLEIGGIDFDRVVRAFDSTQLKQEEIVNLGYKTLLFDAFKPDLPEEIVKKGPLDPLADYNFAVTAKITQVSNQKFARAENLISKYSPVFDPELFGRQGKIMDSWESARHNQAPFDHLILELAKPSTINFISMSTKFHDGNHADFIRIEGRNSLGVWKEIVPKTKFAGHALTQLRLSKQTSDAGPFSAVKLEMYPDGGISRLGLYETLPVEAVKSFSETAKPIRFHDPIPKSKKPLTIPYDVWAEDIHKNLASATEINWASAAIGAKVLNASNEHYGPAIQVISPFKPIHMFDGLESARSRDSGHSENVTIRLGRPIVIAAIELDFEFFINNNPKFVSVETSVEENWFELVPKTAVKAYAGNQIRFTLDSEKSGNVVSEIIRLSVYPDGGVHRIRVYERNPLA